MSVDVGDPAPSLRAARHRGRRRTASTAARRPRSSSPATTAPTRWPGTTGCWTSPATTPAAASASCSINPNDAVRYPRDSFEAMQERVRRDGGWPAPYLHDATQEVAAAYGARTTPDVFVVDAGGRVAYRGAPDADYDDPAPAGRVAARGARRRARRPPARATRGPSRSAARSSGAPERRAPAREHDRPAEAAQCRAGGVRAGQDQPPARRDRAALDHDGEARAGVRGPAHGQVHRDPPPRAASGPARRPATSARRRPASRPGARGCATGARRDPQRRRPWRRSSSSSSCACRCSGRHALMLRGCPSTASGVSPASRRPCAGGVCGRRAHDDVAQAGSSSFEPPALRAVSVTRVGARRGVGVRRVGAVGRVAVAEAPAPGRGPAGRRVAEGDRERRLAGGRRARVKSGVGAAGTGIEPSRRSRRASSGPSCCCWPARRGRWRR